MNLEKITSGDELVSLFPDKFNANMDEIDAAVGDNASDISALDTRLTTAEGDIDAVQNDITALNQGFAQSYTVKTVTNAYGTMVNRYVVIGKLVIGQVDVTPSQTIGTSVGDFASATDAPPAVITTCTVHLHEVTEQKTQYVVMRPSGTWAAYGAYTANSTVSGVYCYMTA